MQTSMFVDVPSAFLGPFIGHPDPSQCINSLPQHSSIAGLNFVNLVKISVKIDFSNNFFGSVI